MYIANRAWVKDFLIGCGMLRSEMSVIYLSFDQDWAPDWAVRAVHERLHAASLTGTFFVTHQSPVLEELRKGDVFELGGAPQLSARFQSR